LSAGNIEHEPRRTAPFPNGDVTTVSQVSQRLRIQADLHRCVWAGSIPIIGSTSMLGTP
jgi:hypothetical protein